MNEERPEAMSLLQDAHTRMCEQCLTILSKEDPTPQELEFVRKFLKDNKVDALPMAGSPLGNVVKTAEETHTIKLPSFPSGLLDEDDPAVQGVG